MALVLPITNLSSLDQAIYDTSLGHTEILKGDNSYFKLFITVWEPE